MNANESLLKSQFLSSQNADYELVGRTIPNISLTDDNGFENEAYGAERVEYFDD
jgi:hypothetical protein